MSTISNSASDCTFSPTGLPDELSPAAQAQFQQENNDWIDERDIEQADEQSFDPYEYWHARHVAEAAAFHAEFDQLIRARQLRSDNIAALVRAIA